VPKPVRVILAVLLLCAPAVWWALRADSDAPALPAAPVTRPAPPPQVVAEASEASEAVPEEAEENAPLKEPVEDGPGPCIELEVTANGAPAAGARVLTAFTSADRRGFREGAWRLGASGRARSWCNPGKYTLAVELPGFAPELTKVESTPGGKDSRLRIELQAGHALLGHVLDEVTLQPVVGARLSATLASIFRSDLDRTPVTTDAQGSFQLSHLTAGEYSLEVEAPGYTAASEYEVQVPSTAPLSIRLEALCRLEGQVIDGATGAPVPGAEVWVSQFGYVHSDDEPKHADAQGHFSLEVEEGEHHLSARSGEDTGAYEGKVSVEQGNRVEGLIIRLGASGLLSGKVFTLSNRQPVVGASLTALHVASGWSYSAKSDATGAFRVERLPAGKYELTAEASGFAEARRGGLQLEPGQELTVELAFTHQSSLEGTVVDALGRPAVKMLVTAKLLEVAADPEDDVPYALTNAKGQYSIQKLPPGRYQLEAKGLRGGQALTRELTLGEGEAARADFTLAEATGQVEGTVRRVSGGLPLHRVSVGATSEALPMATWARVDEAGHFTLELEPGTYTLMATYYQVDESELTRQQVTVETGKTTQVELTVADTVMETSGIVLDAKGAPVPEADVTLANDDLEADDSTDERGHFTLKTSEKSAGALVTLTAELGPEYATVRDVRVGSRNVVVRLMASASLKGRVTARAGVPVKGFSLSVNRGKDGDTLIDSRSFTGDSFALSGLPADTLELLVRTTDGRSGKAQVRLEPGGTGEVELLVGGLGRVVGRIVNAAGAPYEAWVTVDSEKEGERTADVSESGRFELFALEPGPHVLEFPLPDSENENEDEDEEEQVRELPFTLRPGETLDLGDLSPTPRSAGR
jgi:hypothetical protein